MKNRRLSVQVSKTINTGNYESLKLQVGIEADISDSAELENEYEILWDIVEDELTEKLGNTQTIKNPTGLARITDRIKNRKPKVRR